MRNHTVIRDSAQIGGISSIEVRLAVMVLLNSRQNSRLNNFARVPAYCPSIIIGVNVNVWSFDQQPEKAGLIVLVAEWFPRIVGDCQLAHERFPRQVESREFAPALRARAARNSRRSSAHPPLGDQAFLR